MLKMKHVTKQEIGLIPTYVMVDPLHIVMTGYNQIPEMVKYFQCPSVIFVMAFLCVCMCVGGC